MPTASPLHEGTIMIESKKGKWNKRILKLREHSLFLSKKESERERDEIFLCSLSNFDGYAVTRVHRGPKPFAFAVRSTDNLSMFENQADSVHVFCCERMEGEIFLEKILLARVSFPYVRFIWVRLDVNSAFSRTSCTKNGMFCSRHITRPPLRTPALQLPVPVFLNPAQRHLRPSNHHHSPRLQHLSPNPNRPTLSSCALPHPAPSTPNSTSTVIAL